MQAFFNLKNIHDSYDVIIIGGGPAGCAAGMYSARDTHSTLIMEMNTPGGLIGNTDMVENHPGILEPIDGHSLSEIYRKHALRYGAVLKNLSCSRIEPVENAFLVYTEQLNKPLSAKAVIIATGSSPKKLGVTGEERFFGRGVSYCATCDGTFYTGKTVAAVGGGNTALDESDYLTRFAEKVYLIHRRDEFRGDTVAAKAVKKNSKIEKLLSSAVVSINGTNSVESADIKNLKTDKVYTLPIDGIFIFVGLTPYTAPFKGLIDLDEQGYIVSDESTLTNIKGIFAAGDVRVKPVRQIATAASDGVVAAKQAEKYLSGMAK
jgi:thioredoxin reductase (NADPH)